MPSSEALPPYVAFCANGMELVAVAPCICSAPPADTPLNWRVVPPTTSVTLVAATTDRPGAQRCTGPPHCAGAVKGAGVAAMHETRLEFAAIWPGGQNVHTPAGDTVPTAIDEHVDTKPLPRLDDRQP